MRFCPALHRRSIDQRYCASKLHFTDYIHNMQEGTPLEQRDGLLGCFVHRFVHRSGIRTTGINYCIGSLGLAAADFKESDGNIQRTLSFAKGRTGTFCVFETLCQQLDAALSAQESNG